MFCKSCGQALADGLRFCDRCGVPVNDSGPSAASPLSHRISGQVKARSRDAWQAMKLFVTNPVGGLSASFELFDDRLAVQVAIVFAVIYEVSLLVGLLIFKSKVDSAASQVTQLLSQRGGLSAVMPSGDLTATQVLKVLLLGLVPFASLSGATAVARAIFRGKGNFSGDLYTSGAALLPSAFLVLAAALLGVANVEVTLILFVFALTYSILILYAGCSRIGKISESGAALAVPVILVLSAWITKILAVALWQS